MGAMFCSVLSLIPGREAGKHKKKIRSDASLHISAHSQLVKVTNYPHHYVFYFLIYGCYGFILLSTGITKSHLASLWLLMIKVL